MPQTTDTRTCMRVCTSRLPNTINALSVKMGGRVTKTMSDGDRSEEKTHSAAADIYRQCTKALRTCVGCQVLCLKACSRRRCCPCFGPEGALKEQPEEKPAISKNSPT